MEWTQKFGCRDEPPLPMSYASTEFLCPPLARVFLFSFPPFAWSCVNCFSCTLQGPMQAPAARRSMVFHSTK